GRARRRPSSSPRTREARRDAGLFSCPLSIFGRVRHELNVFPHITPARRDRVVAFDGAAHRLLEAVADMAHRGVPLVGWLESVDLALETPTIIKAIIMPM
ncbi:hypothetical protein, partial [uncultured Methylobacterium sp.]|uniref:hypothetical protein n=1 Tax=uncultured Methylobacterium sp. TaxID=157278 RepID=UPI0035CADAF9